jgi:hypothetical protein
MSSFGVPAWPTGEGAEYVDDAFLAVNVAFLQGDPLRRAKPCCGREEDHRPISRADRGGDRLQFRPGLERM